MDTLLSFDPAPSDILYRIRRTAGTVNRVLYVTVADPAVIPEDKRTYGPSVIAELGKLEEWKGDWATLRVHKDGDGTRCEVNAFPPHALSKNHIIETYPTHNIFDLPFRREFNHRVSEVLLDGRACVLKIARFPHELSSLAREVEAYHCLAESSLAPKLIGYAFEESSERIIGFLAESVNGRVANINDFEACHQSLQRLHAHLVHGDLCKYNIIITPDGRSLSTLKVQYYATQRDGAQI